MYRWTRSSTATVVGHAGLNAEARMAWHARPGQSGDGDPLHLPAWAGVPVITSVMTSRRGGGVEAGRRSRAKVAARARTRPAPRHRPPPREVSARGADALADGRVMSSSNGRSAPVDLNVVDPLRRRQFDAHQHAAGHGLGQEVDGREPSQVDEMLDRRTDLRRSSGWPTTTSSNAASTDRPTARRRPRHGSP